MLPDVQLSSPLPALAHLDQYAGVWSIEERHARNLIATVNRLNLSVHVAEHQADAAANAKAVDYQTVPTANEKMLAVIRIEGTMTKYGGSLSSQGSTLRARREVRQAMNDPKVTGILLQIDSPGGSVSGTPDLARDVADAAARKPVYAYCEDCCCSAAYYVASQATAIYANENAIVGSIGVYMVVDDFSKLYEEQGVKAHVVKFGAHKAAGVQGTEITDEQLAHWQTEVDTLGEQFVAAVSKGRGLSKSAAHKLADGRVHIGQAAADLKLIDGVQTLDKTLAQLAKAKPAPGQKAADGVDPLLCITEDDGDSKQAGRVDQLIGGSVDQPASESTDPHPKPTAPPSDATHSTPISQETPMSEKTTEAATPAPQAATYSEIAAGCKGFNEDSGDDAKFAGACLKRSLTLAQAKDEWSETLSARLESREQENAQLREQAAKSPATAKPAGNQPLADGDSKTPGSSAGSDAIEQWEAAIAANIAKGMTRKQAASAANREHPGLREASVAAYNAAHKSAGK